MLKEADMTYLMSVRNALATPRLTQKGVNCLGLSQANAVAAKLHQRLISTGRMERAGWCAALEIGRSTFYVLPIRPRTIKLLSRTLVVEAPAEYATRIASLQAA
jgi:hypothetical protein